MFLRIVRNDLSRKKVITVAVFVFVTMAVVLGASATNIIANLIQSMSELQERAVPADIAQMHIGTL
jgi:putative ABC transport system permease protein